MHNFSVYSSSTILWSSYSWSPCLLRVIRACVVFALCGDALHPLSESAILLPQEAEWLRYVLQGMGVLFMLGVICSRRESAYGGMLAFLGYSPIPPFPPEICPFDCRLRVTRYAY